MIPYEPEPTLRRIGLTKGWTTERRMTASSQLLHNNGLRCAWGPSTVAPMTSHRPLGRGGLAHVLGEPAPSEQVHVNVPDGLSAVLPNVGN